jgi:hypothetical protein
VLGTSSRWIAVRLRVETSGSVAERAVLLDTLRHPARVAAVTWLVPQARG